MSGTQRAGVRKPNHLAGEKSPYLRQHMENPVNWFPWTEEAFRRATAEGKPVFVSIGYATCHWCHVMAHESFEDETVAAILNEQFIAIKVDREERPDIDGVYMTVCQQMTGQGGWPLTVILTPKKEPLFAGTYLPRTSRGGMIGLIDLLTRISRLWLEDRDKLEVSAGRLASEIRRVALPARKGTVSDHLLARGYEGLAARFDPVHGGFGSAPKFPTPSILLFLLRFWKRTGSDYALQMAERTFNGMVNGGIHDHLSGGFHRYSTDAQWRIPHFEKMLYDQALILMACTEAWLATKNPLYRSTAEAIIDYVLRDLQSGQGGFFSAEDADSPDGEGAFYGWSRKEFDVVLGIKEGSLAAGLFGVTSAGNFSIPETGQRTNILNLQSRPTGQYPDGEGTGDGPAELSTFRKKLFAARNRRIRPPRDEKILTDWNALFIAALAQAGCAFGDPRYLDAGVQAMQFLQSNLRSPDGGLLHRYCDGEAAIPAFADDYAFMIQALIALYEATFDPDYLAEAVALDHYIVRHFADTVNGGFFFTADNADPLIIRKKEIYDGAVPSCNSIMLSNLVWLGHLTGDPVYLERALSLAENFAGTVGKSPSAYPAFLSGLDLLLGPVTDIVITGDDQAPDTRKMIALLRQEYLPSMMLIGHFPNTIAAGLDTLVPFTRDMVAREGKATAYLCSGNVCSAPVTSLEDLKKLVEKEG